MKRNIIYNIIDWNAKNTLVIPFAVALIALIVEILILNADCLGWYVHTQEKADSINRLCESICLGYLSGFLIYILTAFLPNYIKLYRYKKYVVEDLGDLRNGVRLIMISITDSYADESLKNVCTFYQSVKEGEGLTKDSKELRSKAYIKIMNALNNLNDKRDLFSLEELETMYKLKPHLLSIDKTVKSILDYKMKTDKILAFNACKSLYENYETINSLYIRIRDKYWGDSITD